jgi:DNA-binding transcriptional ArsR family regulator
MQIDSEATEGKSILLELFGGTPEVRLIDFFMDNPLFDFTKKEIIEELKMNKRTLHRVLPKIEAEGIVVVSRKIGRAKLYKINKDSLTVKYLRGIEKTHSQPRLQDLLVQPPVQKITAEEFVEERRTQSRKAER